MSTYLNPLKPNQHTPYEDIPKDLRDFLNYMGAILNRSPRTVNGYYIDLRTFFRFLVQARGLSQSAAFDEIDIRSVDTAFIGQITQAAVSYTHLDVYKRQVRGGWRIYPICPRWGISAIWPKAK